MTRKGRGKTLKERVIVSKGSLRKEEELLCKYKVCFVMIKNIYERMRETLMVIYCHIMEDC